MAKKSTGVSGPTFPDRYEEYKELVEIDREDLEGCLLDQPRLLAEVCQHANVWSYTRDTRKHDAEELYAKLDQKIRAKAADEGAKLTENAIKNLIQEDDEYKLAYSEFLQARYFADLWAGLREAYQARQYSLRELTQIAIRQLDMDSDIISSNKSAQELKNARADKIAKEAGQLRRAKLKKTA